MDIETHRYLVLGYPVHEAVCHRASTHDGFSDTPSLQDLVGQPLVLSQDAFRTLAHRQRRVSQAGRFPQVGHLWEKT